ncbi:MAG: molybdate ABC transporter permease subunit [Spirochaetales bacterium]|nr:molybdate ABC transporter permease subunit [Spirochaetales bacterium]
MNVPDILQTVSLSVVIGLVAILANLPAAIAVSRILTRSNWKGKPIIEGIINLPLVMPPVTIGYLLLLLLGKHGPIGSILFNLFGIRIAFTTAAAIIASMVVSFPLVAGNIRASLEMLDHRFENAALTLGAGRIAVFFRITFPLILPGIISGAITGFARSLGEFGATMTFAGNIQGVTRTIPLSVYSWLQIPGKERESAILVGISVLISFLAMLLSGIFAKRIKRRSSAA